MADDVIVIDGDTDDTASHAQENGASNSTATNQARSGPSRLGGGRTRRPTASVAARAMEAEEEEGRGKKRQRVPKKPMKSEPSDDEADKKKQKRPASKKPKKKPTEPPAQPENYDNGPPPPTINMETAKPETPLAAKWLGKTAARDASLGRTMQARLAGSRVVWFKVTPATLQELQQEHRVASRREVFTNPKRIEWMAFDEDGEFSTPELQIPLSRIMAKLDKKVMKVKYKEDRQFLEYLWALQSPKSSPWKRPFLRLLTHTKKGTDNTASVTFFVYFTRTIFEMIADDAIRGVMSRLTPAGRRIPIAEVPECTQIYKRSSSAAQSKVDDYSLPGVLRAAESMGYDVRDPQPDGLKVTMFEYQRSTLQWMLDHERDTHGGLNAYFWETWIYQDAVGPDDAFYYFPDAGEVRLVKPPFRTGGLLCEEMGLGKTLEVLAVVLSNPRTDIMDIDADRDDDDDVEEDGGEEDDEQFLSAPKRTILDTKIKCKATLVVVPASLLGQWYTEVPKLCADDALEVMVYTGPSRVIVPIAILRDPRTGDLLYPSDQLPSHAELKKVKEALIPWDDPLDPVPLGMRTPVSEARNYRKVKVKRPVGQTGVEVAITFTMSELLKSDVVLTTYDVMRTAGAVLKHLDWHRIVLDEAQEIRTATTQIARQCIGLHAQHRWMVSGTPLATSVDDLHGELAFLDVWPFSLQKDGFWESKIGPPFKQKSPTALAMLHRLIKVTMIRHSKAQTYLDGRPLVSMPPRTIVWQPVENLSLSETFCYAYLEILASKECRRLADLATDLDSDMPLSNSRHGSHAKLRTLLFFMQRCLTHTTLVPLQQLDTIKRSLQVQERITSRSTGNDIPKLRVDDILMRLQGVGAARPGGLSRDVGRTWALGGDTLVEARSKYESMPLQRLKELVAEHGMASPICWVHLPLFGSIDKLSDLLAVEVNKEADKQKAAKGGPKTTGEENEEQQQQEEEAEEQHKKVLRVDAMLRCTDVIRVGGMHDADAEAVVQDVAVDDEETGERGKLQLERVWQGDSKHRAQVYKRAPASRKKAFIDLLLTKDKEEKGIRSEIHEAGFSAIYSLLEGRDVTCPICMCSVDQPVITNCCHAFCKACVLAQIEQSESNGQASTRCAVCRKPLARASLMQMDCEAVEQYEGEQAATAASSSSGGGAAVGSSSGMMSGSASLASGFESDEDPNDPNGKRPRRRRRPGAQDGPLGSSAGWQTSLPTVGFPPAADDQVLSRIPDPFHYTRDNRMPSLSPSFLAHYNACHDVISSKVKALLSDMDATLAADPSSKFVIFTTFTESINLIASILTARDIKSVQISGHTSKAARQKATMSFAKDDDVKVFILTMGAGAVGLTLTAANVLYLMEPSHSLADEAQALNRAHRIGQTRPVRCVIFFARGTVEERMLALRKSSDAFVESAEALSVTRAGGSEAERAAHFSLSQLMVMFGLKVPEDRAT